MTEPKIRDYFKGLINIDKLIEPDSNATGKIQSYYKEVKSIESGNFQIKTTHLIKLCNDVLEGKIYPDILDSISFILIGSDYFDWDSETKDGKIISEVIFEWNNPTINYPLTISNIEQWKKYLKGKERKMNNKNGS